MAAAFITTITKTQTAFITVTDCANPLPTFAIQVPGSGTPEDSSFAQIAYPAVESTIVGFFGTSLSEGSIFSLNAAGELLADAEVADVEPGNSFEVFYFNTPGVINANERITTVCSISGVVWH